MRMNLTQRMSLKALLLATMVMILLVGCSSQQSGSSPAPSQAAGSQAPASTQAPKDPT